MRGDIELMGGPPVPPLAKTLHPSGHSKKLLIRIPLELNFARIELEVRFPSCLFS